MSLYSFLWKTLLTVCFIAWLLELVPREYGYAGVVGIVYGMAMREG